MPLSSRRPRRLGIDIWPGFVDALSQLVMVIVFVLLIFTAGQFYLTDALSGRDAQLQRLTQQINELTDMLALERRTNSDLRVNVTQLSMQLQTVNRERDALTTQLAELSAKADETTTKLDRSSAAVAEAQRSRQIITGLETQLATAQQQATKAQQDLDSRNQNLSQAQTTVDQLNLQILALRQQLAQIAAALNISEAKSKDQQVQITDLGRRLNQALATKVEELARYRSEFFGRLREVLGNRPDIRIVGDRFVFQSEVLFAQGSADLSDTAKQKLLPVAQALKEIAAKIPPDLNWVLVVEGHTDKRPINTPLFHSNWELSTARATSVVRYLMDQGIPASRLAAEGFSSYQPIDTGDTDAALQRNRRIELKLTEP